MCHQSDSAMCRSPTLQTPINRSLLKAFKKDQAIWSINSIREDSEALRSIEALQESSLKAFKNFKNFKLKIEEHSKQNHPNYLPRSQSSLESSSKASKNLIKSQISETLRIQASKVSKNFNYKPSNMKNIRKEIIQIIFLDLKVHWNQAQKSLETSQTTNQ